MRGRGVRFICREVNSTTLVGSSLTYFGIPSLINRTPSLDSFRPKGGLNLGLN